MYPSRKDGLFGVFVKNFVKNLARQGANFTHLAVIKGKTPSSIKKGLRYLYHYVNSLFHGIFTKSDFIYVHFLWHHTPIIILLGGVFRKKIVVNVHGSDITQFNKSKLQKRLNALALKYAERVVVPSQYFVEIIKDAFPNVTTNNIIVYPSGGINRNVAIAKRFEP